MKVNSNTPVKLRAEKLKKAKISNRQVLERFGETDVLTSEGRRITKTGKPVAKTAVSGFVEKLEEEL